MNNYSKIIMKKSLKKKKKIKYQAMINISNKNLRILKKYN
jgi:hypothetical protein